MESFWTYTTSPLMSAVTANKSDGSTFDCSGGNILKVYPAFSGSVDMDIVVYEQAPPHAAVADAVWHEAFRYNFTTAGGDPANPVIIVNGPFAGHIRVDVENYVSGTVTSIHAQKA